MAWGNQYGYGQPVMQQPQMTTFINVPSEEVAYKWRVDPNTSVNFINEMVSTVSIILFSERRQLFHSR